MRLSNIFTTFTSIFIALGYLVARGSAYFVITQPDGNSQWINGISNPITWQKGVLDDISGFDIEIARLNQNGLTFVAKNVPSTSSGLNIVLHDIPAGDDYFLVFVNATHGRLHATSSRFTILPASSSAKSTQPTAISGKETVTVSGAPNPTQPFATTFPALYSGDLPVWGNAGQAWGLGSVMVGCLIGAAWTLW